MSLENVRAKIGKEGIDTFISELVSGRLPEHIETELSSCGILVSGYPNLSLIYSLS